MATILTWLHNIVVTDLYDINHLNMCSQHWYDDFAWWHLSKHVFTTLLWLLCVMSSTKCYRGVHINDMTVLRDVNYLHMCSHQWYDCFAWCQPSTHVFTTMLLLFCVMSTIYTCVHNNVVTVLHDVNHLNMCLQHWYDCFAWCQPSKHVSTTLLWLFCMMSTIY